MKRVTLFVLLALTFGYTQTSYGAVARIDKFDRSGETPAGATIMEYDYTISWSSPNGYVGLDSLVAHNENGWSVLFSNIYSTSPGPGRVTGLTSGFFDIWKLHVGVKDLSTGTESPTSNVQYPVLVAGGPGGGDG